MKKHKHQLNNLNKAYLFASITFPLRNFLVRITGRLIKKSKVVIVLGLSRSGTTMLGEFLSLGPNVDYLHEPVKQLFERRISKNKAANNQLWKEIFKPENSSLKLHYFISIIFLNLILRKNDQVVCIKEVSMTNVIPDLVNLLKNSDVLYISRHPCGRIDSMIRNRSKDKSISDPAAPTYLANVATNWGRNIKSTQSICNNHLNWNWLIFEELAQEPVESFKSLYRKLELNWTVEIANTITQKTTGQDGGFYQTQRIASRQADKWKENLAQDKINLIKQNTQQFKTNLYPGF